MRFLTAKGGKVLKDTLKNTFNKVNLDAHFKNESLNNISLDTPVKIENLNCTGSLRRRLLDLGLIKGTTIIPVLKSPCGDPTAYSVRGSLIALREEDSSLIDVIK